MGEAKRKWAAQATMEQIRDGYFDMLDLPAKQGAPINRAQLLALLIEKALVLGGFSENESDQLVELMDEVDKRLDTMQPIGEAAERVVQQLPEPPTPPIDPDRMRKIEERGRLVASFVNTAARDLGWIVLLFETGNRPELTYLSNCARDDCLRLLLSNCARDDCLRLLREYIEVLTEGRDFPPDTLTQRPN